MRKIVYTILTIGFLSQINAQVESPEPVLVKSDTTRTKIGNVVLVVVNDKLRSIELNGENPEIVKDTIDASPTEVEAEENESRWKEDNYWGGIDFGVNTMLNNTQGTSFNNQAYWENDPAKSFCINWNTFSRKLPIYKEHIGFVTGLGFNFNQFAFKNNYVLMTKQDSVYAEMDTVFNYSKNKLRASYLQIPLLVEFASSGNESKSWHLTTGIIGGLRLSSKTKREGDIDGKSVEDKVKGVYHLNSFKADATVRLGYGNVGIFATYALIPLFESGKTVPVHPVTFGLSVAL